MKKNPNLALSIDVFLKNIVNTNFGCTGRYIMSWARDIFILSCTFAYCVSIKFTFGKLHFKDISNKLQKGTKGG